MRQEAATAPFIFGGAPKRSMKANRPVAGRVRQRRTGSKLNPGDR